MPKPRATKASPRANAAPKAPKARVTAPKPAAAKVALRVPNTRATNPLITKAINARKSIKTK